MMKISQPGEGWAFFWALYSGADNLQSNEHGPHDCSAQCLQPGTKGVRKRFRISKKNKSMK